MIYLTLNQQRIMHKALRRSTRPVRDAEWKEEEHKRDEGGKFSATGGGEAAKPDKPDNSPDLHAPEARQDWANGITERYGLPRQEIRTDPELSGHGILAHASGNGISLNPDYFGNPEKYAEYQKQWGGGMMADASAQGTLLHEIGHKMFQQIKPPAGMSSRFYQQWYRKKDAIVQKYFDDPELVVSAYAQEHPHEWAAEAFAAQHNGALEWPYTQKAADGAKAMWQELFAHGDREPSGRLKTGAKPRATG